MFVPLKRVDEVGYDSYADTDQTPAGDYGSTGVNIYGAYCSVSISREQEIG